MLQTDAGPAVTARLPARASWMAGAPLAFGTSAPSRLVPVLHVVMGTPGAGVCEPASRRPRIGSESRGRALCCEPGHVAISGAALEFACRHDPPNPLSAGLQG